MPNSAATRSKRATATNPQLSAPTTTRTAAMTSICFMTSSCRASGSFPTVILNVMQINLLESKIRRIGESRVSVTTKPRAEFDRQEKRRRDALGDAAERAERLRHRREDSDAAAEEEDGARRARASTPDCRRRCSRRSSAGRLFPTLPTLLRIALVFGVGLEFFFAGAREKPLVAVVRKARARPACPSGPGARQCIPFRVARLPGNRATVQLLLRGIPPGGARRATAARPSAASSSSTRCRARSACTSDGERACAAGRRHHVLRRQHSARVPAEPGAHLQCRGDHGGVGMSLTASSDRSPSPCLRELPGVDERMGVRPSHQAIRRDSGWRQSSWIGDASARSPSATTCYKTHRDDHVDGLK